MKKLDKLTMELSMNTDKISKKARIISKHLLALANELDGVDDSFCDDCGSSEYKKISMLKYHDRTLYNVECIECGNKYQVIYMDDKGE